MEHGVCGGQIEIPPRTPCFFLHLFLEFLFNSPLFLKCFSLSYDVVIISQETMNSSADLLVLHSCFIVRKTTSYDFNSLKRNGKCMIIRKTYRIFAVSERKTKQIYSRTNTREDDKYRF